MKRLSVLLTALLLVGPIGSRAEESDPAAARQVVEAFHGVLLGCMRDAEQLGFRGRYDRMFAALGDAFDLPFMARTALGSAWKELTDEELAEFIALSHRLSATRYADNFDSDGGQRFETHGVEPAARGTLLVLTELIQPGDDNVRFDYRLRKTRDGWRIIDVQLDGMISELTLRRSQYRSVIKREGFPRLVEIIESKIEELSGE